jgi:hypothetical protein
MSVHVEQDFASRPQLIAAGTSGSWDYEKWIYPDGSKVWKGRASDTLATAAANWVAYGNIFRCSLCGAIPGVPAGVSISTTSGYSATTRSSSSNYIPWATVTTSGIVFGAGTANTVSITYIITAEGTWV